MYYIFSFCESVYNIVCVVLGLMKGTIHRQLVKDYPTHLVTGTVLVLRQVCINMIRTLKYDILGPGLESWPCTSLTKVCFVMPYDVDNISVTLLYLTALLDHFNYLLSCDPHSGLK